MVHHLDPKPRLPHCRHRRFSRVKQLLGSRTWPPHGCPHPRRGRMRSHARRRPQRVLLNHPVTRNSNLVPMAGSDHQLDIHLETTCSNTWVATSVAISFASRLRLPCIHQARTTWSPAAKCETAATTDAAAASRRMQLLELFLQ